MKEKNILAFFKSPEEAESAASKLRSLRVVDMSIERFSRYPGEGVDRIMNPITGDIPSLGSLTLDADFSNRSAAVMAAADPSASGMSDGGQGGPTGRDILLTVIVSDSEYDKAVRVLEECGAWI